jgi:uncharacterized Zn-finger protein
MRTMTRSSFYLVCVVLLVCPLLAGCSSRPRFGTPGPRFSESLEQGAQTLDIQVSVEDTAIVFTNTTAERFEHPRVWLNRWYSMGLDRIEPGERVELSLSGFVDEEGRSPRPGGFFASRLQEPIALVEIQEDSVLHSLVVVSTADR